MLTACQSVADLRIHAQRCLPTPIFHFLDGGAETEATVRRNTNAFDNLQLIPRCLIDVGAVKTAVRLLGQEVEWPVLCSPTGASRLFHPHGELAAARAAADTGTLYSLSTYSTYSLEEVALVDGPKVFQLYVLKDRDMTRALIERCRMAKYRALCITVDVPAIGNRERDRRSGISGRMRWNLHNVISFARRPAWVLGQLRAGPRYMPNIAHTGHNGRRESATRVTIDIDPSVTWKDIRAIRDLWSGPLALKGVMSPDDARRAADVGVTAVIVSNHGGRQLDGAAASIEVLPEIVRAVGNRVEVILDGGIRRGTHVLKALALGAKGCSIGRPYLYGLAVAGQAGATKALHILREELILAMRLSGCVDVASVGEDIVRRSPSG